MQRYEFAVLVTLYQTVLSSFVVNIKIRCQKNVLTKLELKGLCSHRLGRAVFWIFCRTRCPANEFNSDQFINIADYNRWYQLIAAQ